MTSTCSTRAVAPCRHGPRAFAACTFGSRRALRRHSFSGRHQERRPPGRGVALRATQAPAVDRLVLQPIKRIEGEVRLPGSKSLSNRVLLLAALAAGQTVVDNVLVRCLGPRKWEARQVQPAIMPSTARCNSCFQDSEDIHYMVSALETLGVTMDVDWPARRITVQGCAGRFPSIGAELFLGNAGTAMRWVLARAWLLRMLMPVMRACALPFDPRPLSMGASMTAHQSQEGVSVVAFSQTADSSTCSSRPGRVCPRWRAKDAGAAHPGSRGRTDAAGRRCKVHTGNGVPSRPVARQGTPVGRGAGLV